MDNEERQLPHSKESEIMVLGCMLTNVSSLTIAREILDEGDFYHSEHRLIFQVLKANCCDIHLVAEELKRQEKLKDVGGIAYLTTLAQYAGTSANIEEYATLVRDKAILRRMIHAAQTLEKRALKSPSDVLAFLYEVQQSFSSIDQVTRLSQLPLMSMAERIHQLDEKLEESRGKKYLGLCQKTIPDIDENLLGLRKFILLAAAPNVGKTALTIQLAIDVLQHHQDACMVYFSLEMSAMDILIRIFCNLSKLDYRTFVLGSFNQERSFDPSAYFKQEERLAIEQAKTFLGDIGNRLQIIDSAQAQFLDARKAISFIDELKKRTGSKRVIVVIDYLQVWPLSQQLKFVSELEVDKWRVGEIKKIRDAINDDPVLVISEARKPSGKDAQWGGDLSDVMGSARATYSPDGVMLFTQVNPEDTIKLCGTEKPQKEDIDSIENHLQSQGIAICRLDFPKARDGMQRFSQLLEFHYRKSIFRPTSVAKIKVELEKRKKR